MAAPHQQHQGWETWTGGHSQTEPQTHGSALPALIPHSNPGNAVPARVCDRHSRLKHRGGLCCYYQPYTATLAVEAMRAEDVSLLGLTGERAMRFMCEKRARDRRQLIIFLVLISLSSKMMPVLCSRTKSKGWFYNKGSVQSKHSRVLCSHISACWRDNH